jgi:hypothetical protein
MSVESILLAQGRSAGEAARAKRQVWGEALSNISQLPLQIQHERRQQRRQDAITLLEQARELRARGEYDLAQRKFAEAERTHQNQKQITAAMFTDDPTTPNVEAGVRKAVELGDDPAWAFELGQKFKPKPAESFTLGEGQIRYTAEGTEVARGADKTERPINVAPGGTVLDPKTGQPLFTAPQAPMTPYQKAELEFQRQRLEKEPAEPLVPIMGPDGKPVLVRRSQAEGKQPASSREQGRPVTSGDAGRIAEIDSSLDDVQRLGVALSAAGETGTVAKIGASMPNWVTDLSGWGIDAKKKQALIDRVKQVIGKALEGGVLRKEDELKYEKILPTIGDTTEVVKAKLQGLDTAVRGKRERSLESLGDAGYDVSRFQRTERQSTSTPLDAAWAKLPKPPANAPAGAMTPEQSQFLVAHPEYAGQWPAQPNERPAPTKMKLGDVVTVKGQRLRVTKINPDGSYEGVGVK